MKPVPAEPKLPSRDEYYDLANKLEWTPKYVKEEELFPVDMSGRECSHAVILFDIE